MAEKENVKKLNSKLTKKATRVNLRYKYYEQKYTVRDMGISTPPGLKAFQPKIGWCAKAVDCLGDRLVFREFENDNFYFNEIFALNNPDVLFDSAITSALISSCSFIYITVDEGGFPVLQVIDGANATGHIDDVTNLLYDGYAVLERDDKTGKPSLTAYFEPFITTYYDGKGDIVETSTHSVPYPLLVPIIHRPDAKRPFGHSRISRACIDILDMAVRTLFRSEISAEFYSFPQKWITGLDKDYDTSEVSVIEKWKASMSTILTFNKDEDGDSPSFGNFSQTSMQPHIEQLRMIASMFGSETGLTLDDLGFPSDNPSSAEAIKSAHETLRSAARKAQRNFSTGFINVGMLAASLRDKKAYKRNEFYKTKAVWAPIFEPDMSAMSTFGDAVQKTNIAVPGFFGRDNLSKIMDIEPEPQTPAPSLEDIVNGNTLNAEENEGGQLT